MSHATTHRAYEARRTLRDLCGDIAEHAGRLLADRSLSHDQRAALLGLMEHAWAASDALEVAQ